MNITSAGVAHDVNELELSGLTPEFDNPVSPAWVKEAPVHLEPMLNREVELPAH